MNKSHPNPRASEGEVVCVCGGGGEQGKEDNLLCKTRIDNTSGLPVTSVATAGATATAGPRFDLDNFSIE
jgi:hypothetical protein